MVSHLTDLQESLLSLLECPVCTEYMVPPIMLCVNGRNICNICRPKLADCPTCRNPFLSTRSLALEKLAREVKYPSTYRYFGCGEFFALDELDEHSVSCRYELKCPAAMKHIHEYYDWRYRPKPCDWTGNYKEVKNHLMENHLEMCSDYGETESRSLDGCLYTGGCNKFVFVYNEVFFRHFFCLDNTFAVAVQYIGPPEKAAKYKYRVEFVNTDNTEGVRVMHLTISFLEHVRDVFDKGNCAKVLYGVLSRLINLEGNLKFKLEILRVGD